MTQLINVTFHQDNLIMVEHNGQPYVAMKPIVENMGLAWQPQHRKLKAKRWGVTILMIPTNGHIQEMICLPLRKIFGWLNTISPNKVKPELKSKIEIYQDECDEVLWQHWTNKHQSIQDRLNALLQQEGISQAKGSFHGKGLSQRRSEKKTNERTMIFLQAMLQPQLTDFEQALAS